MVNYAGDAVLAEFGTVAEAVTSAVVIQREVAGRQALPDDRQVKLRIGINLGDVIVDGGDIFGDGVNVAARVQSLAEPGGICITDSVRLALGGKLALRSRTWARRASRTSPSRCAPGRSERRPRR